MRDADKIKKLVEMLEQVNKLAAELIKLIVFFIVLIRLLNQ